MEIFKKLKAIEIIETGSNLMFSSIFKTKSFWIIRQLILLNSW